MANVFTNKEWNKLWKRETTITGTEELLARYQKFHGIDWREITKSDLDFTYNYLTLNTPFLSESQEYTFPKHWLKLGYNYCVRELVGHVKTYDDYCTVMRYYMSLFRDAHSIKMRQDFELRQKLETFKYPGFGIFWRNKRFYLKVIPSEGPGKSGGPINLKGIDGMELTHCNGIPIRNYINKYVLKFHPTNSFPVVTEGSYLNNCSFLTFWNGFLMPQKVKFTMRSGGTATRPSREITIFPEKCKQISYDEQMKIMIKLYNITIHSEPKYNVYKFDDDGLWITFPSFMNEPIKNYKNIIKSYKQIMKKSIINNDLNSKFVGTHNVSWFLDNIIAPIIERVKKKKFQQDEPYIVLDMRQNVGGYEYILFKLIAAIYGKKLANKIMKIFIRCKISPDNADYYLYNAHDPHISGEMVKLIDKKMTNKLLTVDTGYKLEDIRDEIISSTKSIISFPKIYVITCPACNSATIMFLYYILKLPNTVQIGQATNAYPAFVYPRSETLPSELGEIVFPTAVMKIPHLLNGMYFTPYYVFNGDIYDTTKVKEWFKYLRKNIKI